MKQIEKALLATLASLIITFVVFGCYFNHIYWRNVWRKAFRSWMRLSPGPFFALFLTLSLSHYVTDYALQKRISLGVDSKIKFWPPALFIHVLTVTFFVVPISCFTAHAYLDKRHGDEVLPIAMIWWLIAFVSHCITDYTKSSIRVKYRDLFLPPLKSNPRLITLHLVDQGSHFFFWLLASISIGTVISIGLKNKIASQV